MIFNEEKMTNERYRWLITLDNSGRRGGGDARSETLGHLHRLTG
jgi:hypothetical protein